MNFGRLQQSVADLDKQACLLLLQALEKTDAQPALRVLQRSG
jgi:hypothetical protein